MRDSGQKADALMRSAWKRRAASFELSAEERSREIETCARKLRTAVELCRKADDTLSLAQALHLSANVEVDRGDEQRAQELWEESIALLRASGDPLQLAHKVRHLGDLHRRLDRLAEADRCFREALELYRTHDSSGSLDFANAVSRLAELREHEGHTSDALALWEETRELYAACELREGVDMAARSIERCRAD